MLQRSIGLLQPQRLNTCLGLQMRIVNSDCQCDAEQPERGNADSAGKPIILQAHAAAAERTEGKARRRHTGVVHAADRQTHHDGRRDARKKMLERLAVAQTEEQPQRHERRGHRDDDRERHEQRII